MASTFSPPISSIQASHVPLQFARRKQLQGARFLLDEIAQRMLDRLQYIRISPNTMIDMGCATGLRFAALHRRYPNAHYIGVDNCAVFIQEARQQAKAKGLGVIWQKLRPSTSPTFLLNSMEQVELPAETAEMIWSNLALHWHHDLPRLMAEWYRLLTVGGLCMFSCFGPHTLIEVRNALLKAGLHTQPMRFNDMHDIGDSMLENGFVDPVMDQEVITLTYKTSDKLLADVYNLGGNPSIGRSNGLKTRGWYTRLLDGLEAGRQADGLLHLTFEVVYGHAWRSASRQRLGETKIAVSSIKAMR